MSVPKGKAAEGRLAGDHLGARDHRRRRRLRAVPQQHQLARDGLHLLHLSRPERLARAGYAVVQTDYQGLGTPGNHPYLIGEAEGRSVLDIVTAARQLDPKIGKRFLISGHSQGGQSAPLRRGRGSELGSPKLKLRGTVAFAPASHLLDQHALLPLLTSPSSLTALATLILDGASTQSSAINVNALLSDHVLAFFPLLQSQCLSQLARPTSSAVSRRRSWSARAPTSARSTRCSPR